MQIQSQWVSLGGFSVCMCHPVERNSLLQISRRMVALAIVLEARDRVIHHRRASVFVFHLSLDHLCLPRNAINSAK